MSREDIPDWEDMPDGISLATLSWEDVYIKACEEMGRNPTRDETIDMFDDTSKSMINAVQDDFPAQLDALIPEIVAECLKSKPYDIPNMTDEQLTANKYCHECQEIQETYWEINCCEKNPKGFDVFDDNHGNENTCEDGYCKPDSYTVEKDILNTQYVQSHAVFEKCVECHQYFDSAGPQGPQSTNVCKRHYNYANTDNELLVADAKDCKYCICDNAQKADSDVADSQQCKNCSGRGWSMEDCDGAYDEIQCDNCNGTG